MTQPHIELQPIHSSTSFAARSQRLLAELRRRPLRPRQVAGLLRGLLLIWGQRNVSGGPWLIEAGADIRINRRARVTIGRMVCAKRNFTGHFVGEVTIGNNVYFNRNCHVVAYERLLIGDNCMFGELVSIHDENHIPGRSATPLAQRGFRTAPISIGANVWVGAKATILQGVSIGEGAVVGANAVVTGDVPPYTVVGGIPARIIRALDFDTGSS